jgi:hypothetical protein
MNGPVGEFSETWVMSDHQDRGTFLVQFLEQFHYG